MALRWMPLLLACAAGLLLNLREQRPAREYPHAVVEAQGSPVTVPPALPGSLALMLSPAERMGREPADPLKDVVLLGVEQERLPLVVAAVAEGTAGLVATVRNLDTGRFHHLRQGQEVLATGLRLAGVERSGPAGRPQRLSAVLKGPGGQRILIGREPAVTGRVVAILRVGGQPLRVVAGHTLAAPDGTELTIASVDPTPAIVIVTTPGGQVRKLAAN